MSQNKALLDQVLVSLLKFYPVRGLIPSAALRSDSLSLQASAPIRVKFPLAFLLSLRCSFRVFPQKLGKSTVTYCTVYMKIYTNALLLCTILREHQKILHYVTAWFASYYVTGKKPFTFRGCGCKAVNTSAWSKEKQDWILTIDQL